jgi:hypothetical protein
MNEKIVHSLHQIVAALFVLPFFWSHSSGYHHHCGGTSKHGRASRAAIILHISDLGVGKTK